mgnify:CR=1 FL=1
MNEIIAEENEQISVEEDHAAIEFVHSSHYLTIYCKLLA